MSRRARTVRRSSTPARPRAPEAACGRRASDVISAMGESSDVSALTLNDNLADQKAPLRSGAEPRARGAWERRRPAGRRPAAGSAQVEDEVVLLAAAARDELHLATRIAIGAGPPGDRQHRV